MSNHEGAHIGLSCDFCDKEFEFDVWFLVDVRERPDLLAKIKEGTIYDAVCPHCNYINRINSDLLLYRPTEDPVLLFSPAENVADIIKNRKSCQQLINLLKRKLGNAWRDEWISVIISVQRSHLAQVLREGQAAFQNQSIQDAKPLELIQKLIHAEQWEGTKDVLLCHSELLEDSIMRILDDIVGKLRNEGKRDALVMFDEYRQLLQRCREIGVEAAITEKRKSSGTAI